MQTEEIRSNIEIKELTTEDIPEIVHIHIESFPESLMTRLGAEILQKYYEWHFDESHKIVKVAGAVYDGKCIGFILTGVFNGSTSGFVRKNIWLIIKEAAVRPWLLFDKKLIKKFKSGTKILTSTFTKKPPVNNPRVKSYGLVSLAVSPAYRKLGAGKILMEEFELIAKNCGYSRTDFTVEPTNYKAVNLYEKLGWQRTLSNGEWKGAMEKDIEDIQ